MNALLTVDFCVSKLQLYIYSFMIILVIIGLLKWVLIDTYITEACFTRINLEHIEAGIQRAD